MEILAKFRSCELNFGPVVVRLKENWTFMFHCHANFLYQCHCQGSQVSLLKVHVSLHIGDI